MTAPDYVPVPLADRPRTALGMPPSRRWVADRPADLKGRQPLGRHMGNPGPDQGYALSLARRFADRVRLAEGEHAEDAVAGALGVALRRASMFGRAPVIHDLDLALRLFGFLDGAPADLVEWRKPVFSGASHHYWDQRDISDLVPDATLRLTPAQVQQRLSDWRGLLGIGPAQ